MNRKKFLQTASTGVLAASLLPLLSFTKNRKVHSISGTYESVKETNINETMWSFEFLLNSSFLTLFDDKTGKERRINITGINDKDVELQLMYEAISMEKKMVDSKQLHFLTCKLNKNEMAKSAKNLAEDSFGSNIQMEIHDGCHSIVKDSKSKFSVDFKYNSTGDLTECFLTSATVFHKGLSDDCKELTTLRNLREKVMKPHPEYSSLISEYKIIAPKMLLNINAAENKDEILESIYNNLVLPSVALVENGKSIEAVEHYRDFVQEMKVLYLS